MFLFCAIGDIKVPPMGAREISARSWQLYTLQKFMKELLRSIGVGVVSHKDTRRWVVKYRIALVGAAIIESYTEQVRMIFKLRRQVKTELPAEKELIVVYRQRIATRQTWN